MLPGAKVVVDPVLVTEALEPARDLLACGPEPMLRAVARIAPEAQLAWEAPMACGFGACYGCVVELGGQLRRLCLDGPVLKGRDVLAAPDASERGCRRVILNGSGCLDALAAPDVARGLDVFVTKTVTPLPREGNAPIRIAESEVGMLNSIGLPNPRHRPLPGRFAARARSPGHPDLGLGRRLFRA